MAIETVNARYEGFIFDGQNSRNYGVYVTDVEVFGAPVRNVEMIQIPGRNGAYALDNGFYENIQVTYKCAMGCESQADFNAGISAFRNMLASRIGYNRLEDEINTDEYRMACFHGGISVPTLNKDTATFDVVFDCKPQRFLKSGETAVTIGGSVTNTQTESGSVVSIESDGGDAVTSLIAQIDPVQAGSGDPSPTNVRPITGWTDVNVFVSPTTTASDGTTTTTSLGRTVYGGTVDVVTGVLKIDRALKVFNGSENISAYGAFAYGARFVSSALDNNSKINQTTILTNRFGTGNTESHMTISSGSSRTNFYIKTGDIGEGVELNAANFKAWLASNNLQVVYELATPQTYNLTAQEVELLTGQNHVWADTGDITITWGDDPNKLVNPTLYDSHPLLHVWGYGDIGIGGGTLSINNDEYGRTLLANRLSKSATSVSSYLDESAVLMLNSGDDVFVSAGSSVVFPLTFRGSASINIISATIANSSPYDFPMESSVSNFGNYVTVSVSLPQLDFIFNQTLQHLRSNIRVTINYTEAGVSKTSTAECQIHAQYSLTPLGRYRVALFYYDVAVDKFHNPSTAVMTIQPIYGVSTQRPFSDDADFYFDLDIGEAYKIEDGQIISVNNAVTIPAQLPTLKSGANTITYDDTITQFKVVPRWWEV